MTSENIAGTHLNLQFPFPIPTVIKIPTVKILFLQTIFLGKTNNKLNDNAKQWKVNTENDQHQSIMTILLVLLLLYLIATHHLEYTFMSLYVIFFFNFEFTLRHFAIWKENEMFQNVIH